MEVLSHRQLTPRGDGSQALRILQLTDIHQFPIEASSWFCAGRGRVIDFQKEGYSAGRSSELISVLCQEVRPDLVIFTGDIIDGRPFAAAGRDGWRGIWHRPIDHSFCCAALRCTLCQPVDSSPLLLAVTLARLCLQLQSRSWR